MAEIVNFISYKDSKNLKKLTNPNYDQALARQNIIKNLETIGSSLLKAKKTELRDNAISGINRLMAFYKYTDLENFK